MSLNQSSFARPSRWWLIASAAAVFVAVASTALAIAVQSEASRPIGEGDLFLNDASAAAHTIDGDPGSEMQVLVRHIRNNLEIEAVSVVASDGVVSVSTSPTLEGRPVTNPVVAFAHGTGVFAAAALPISESVLVDGVPEWQVGDTLYAVVHPMAGGQSLLLHYDISELLARRSQSSGVRPATLALLGIAVVAAAVAWIATIARSRARTRFTILERESRLLRQHADELAASNVELDTARAAAEQALELAEEKNRIRGEFVMMINHELRTPLTSMVTGTQILSEGDLDPDSRAAVLDAMLHDGDRLERMISQILAVARVENRGLNSTVVLMDVDAMWESVAPMLPLSATVTSEVRDELVVETDCETVGHLVSSLVDNAFQHGAHHVAVKLQNSPSIEPQVSVGCTDVKGIAISVADDGPGIAEEFLPRMFEKFEKDSFSSGTGLGLYVVRLMADAIGSSVSVSTAPSGTVFEIVIPAKPVSAPVEARA